MKKKIIICITLLIIFLVFSTVSAQLSVGQIITMGSYEKGTGKEPISWIVIKVDGPKALLLSESIIEAKAYNDSNTNVTWETSSLRRWLNNDFYNTAFTMFEKNYIIPVTNKNPSTSGTVQGYYFSTNGGRDTVDNVFLLSIDEANDFYNRFKTWRCYVTPYVSKKGGYAGDFNIGPIWWLRSPGSGENCAAMVSGDGILTNCFEAVNIRTIGVRPALWIMN